MLDDNLTLSILMGASDVKLPVEEPKDSISVTETIPKDLDSNELLSELLNKPALDSLLTKFSSEALLNLSVRELLSEYSLNSLSVPWAINTNTIQGTFEFECYHKLSRFHYSINSATVDNDVIPNSININKTNNKWLLAIELPKKEGNESLTLTELKVLQYINYCYTNIHDYKSYNDYYYSETTSNSVEKLGEVVTQTISTELLNASLQCFYDAEKLMVRIPIAKVCSYKHPVYGEVVFTEKDLSELKANLDKRVLGFEPPLFLGHPINDGTIEGHPAEGFFSHYEEQDGILFGFFEIVEEETYNSVDKGRYRYSSGEFVRNYQDKNSGEDVGLVFIGMALTNRPFIPDLPRNEALSEGNNSTQNTIKNVFFLSEEINNSRVDINSDDMKESITQEEFSTFKSTVLEEVSALRNSYAEQVSVYDQKLSEIVATNEVKLTELTTSYEQKLSETVAELSVFKSKAEYAEKQLKLTELTAKLTELNNLALPEEVKQEYSEKFKSGSLGDQEEAVMGMLRTWGNSTALSATKQHGFQTATEALNDPSVQDPYKSVIERNLSEVKAREQKLSQLLA
jgi:hypothetical protein